MALYLSIADAFAASSDAFAASFLPEGASAPSARDKDGRVHSQKMHVEHHTTLAKPAHHQPAVPRPPQESGSWLDNATALWVDNARYVEQGWNAAKTTFTEDSAPASASSDPSLRYPSAQRMKTAALSNDIATMDTPFGSRELPRGGASARAPVVEQQSAPRLRANPHQCYAGGPFDDKCIDCHLDSMVGVPWKQWGGHRRAPAAAVDDDKEVAWRELCKQLERESLVVATPPASHPLPHHLRWGAAPAFQGSASGASDHRTPDTAPASRATPFSEPASPAGEGGDAFGVG